MPASIIDIGSRRWATGVVGGRPGCLKHALGIMAVHVTFRTETRICGIFDPTVGIFSPLLPGYSPVYRDDVQTSIAQALLPMIYRSHMSDTMVESTFCRAMLSLSTVSHPDLTRDRMVMALAMPLKLLGVTGGQTFDDLVDSCITTAPMKLC